jgi:Cu+-exporting ATPase
MNISQTPAATPGTSRGASLLSVAGMTCSNCVRHVTEAIQGVPGVHSAVVTLETRRAAVRWTADAPPDLAAVVQAIEKAGFKAKPVAAAEGKTDQSKRNFSGWSWTLWIGVLGTAPLMIGDWIFGLGLTPWFQWFSFALAGMVQIFAGAQFYRGAWNQLQAGRSNMDTLVALGSTTAFAYSAWALLGGHGGHVFFMEAASIITLISAGHWLESRVSLRASGALRGLLQLAPQTARRIQKAETGGRRPEVGGQKSASPFLNLKTLSFSPSAIRNPQPAIEVEVPVADLQLNDLVALRPGDRVPVDGEVVEGDSAVDEAMLTGESAPVDKTANSRLYAGTLNLNGRLVMRVTGTGEETALAQIIAAVQRAQTSRANIQRLGDRVSNVFVPVVVVVAVSAALWWGLAPESAKHVHDLLAPFLPWHTHVFDTPLAAAFITAAAVLIIACPCAMGLATPAAIMAAANAAARRGILIRDGAALEKAGKITAVLFDKTGTLTVGKPAVAETWPFPKAESGKRKAESGLAASLAWHSTHPVSQAIAKISAEEMQISGWREISGAGVEGKISNFKSQIFNGEGTARLGSLRWLKESGVDFAPTEKFVSEWSGQGATLVGLAVEKNLLALFAVKDTVKPGAAEVIGRLHGQGLKTFLVSGDNTLTAMSIAGQLGIAPEQVFAEVRPEQKAEFVKKLQAQGERVAFVGDGINDAPALTQADLGIAVSRASDVAREAADIILLNSEIEAVPEALGLARAALRTIKQNLFWAFFYNALGVPLAALGFMSPVLCAAAMGVSDLIVIGNALRLARWRE